MLLSAAPLLCVSIRDTIFLLSQRLEERETQRLEKLQRQIDLPRAYQKSLAQQAERREREERVRKLKLEKAVRAEQVCVCVCMCVCVCVCVYVYMCLCACDIHNLCASTCVRINFCTIQS